MTTKATNTIFVNGEVLNKRTDSEKIRIYKGLQQYGRSVNQDTSLNESAQILLDELGCAISNEPRSFSLSDDDTETIENENIVDPSIRKLQPEPLVATDSFIDTNDPFYQLDDEIPQDIQQQREAVDIQNEPSYVSFASGMMMVPPVNFEQKSVAFTPNGTGPSVPTTNGGTSTMVSNNQGGY